MNDFSRSIKAELAARGMTMTKLARQMGYTVQYISDLLIGDRRWNETTMTKACQALNLEMKLVANKEDNG